MPVLKNIFDTCSPHDEIRAGELSLDLFAAKLRLVVEGKAPRVYQDSALFFANTFPTDGLKTLIGEVFGRLTHQRVGAPIIRLETSFGGGKTHDEIALWHIARQGRQVPGVEHLGLEMALLPPHSIQVAAFDGRDFDPENGVYHSDTGITTYTLWGELAYQIGGISGYQLLKGSDEKGLAPGTSVLEQLAQGKPTLIILDELAALLARARGKGIGESNLAKQVVNFLFTLMDLAAASNSLVLVYSLASTADTFGQETQELQDLIRASARQERVLSPSTDIEIYNIVKRRIFNSISAEAADTAADEYLRVIRGSSLSLPDSAREASYAEAIRNSYPFHPELFNLLTKKIAAIPEFQRTRGALRLFAQVVQFLWDHPSNWVPLIHPHHLPIGIAPEITTDLTSRLQRPLMRLPIQADIYNKNGRAAYAQTQDETWRAAGKPPFSSWVARTIFLHSLNQGTTAGVRRPELNLSLLTPDLEIGFVENALERLEAVAWYLDVDPVTGIARFKEEPSINKIIAEEKEQVGLAEAKDDLRSRRDSIFASKFFDLIAAPEGPQDVGDRPDSTALCVMDFNDVTVATAGDPAPELLLQIFNKTGEVGKFRTFRNRLLFLVASRIEIGRAVDLVREYKAIRNILHSPSRLEDLSESQQRRLKQREGEQDLMVRVALTNAYRHLFYPTQDPVKAAGGLLHYTLPAQDASMVKGNRNQQEVILKALKDCQKIRSDEAMPYAPIFILQKVWPGGLDHWSTKALKEAFAKDLSLHLLLEGEYTKLRDTIRQGIANGDWDLQVGNKLFIKTDAQTPTPPAIEFSEEQQLYRRGLLKPPEPRQVELSGLSYDTLNGNTARLRWRAKEALSVQLYCNNEAVSGEFSPSDEVEVPVQAPTVFRLVATYGDGESVEQTVTVSPPQAGGAAAPAPPAKPTLLATEGTPSGAFNDLRDQLHDLKAQGIPELTLSVASVMDYRKLATTLPLLSRFPISLDQNVTIQTGQQFFKLQYQGDLRGFQTFLSGISTLLAAPETQAYVSLSLRLAPDAPWAIDGRELTELEQALMRNPVERLQVRAGVVY
jgi:hypothetical protein